jgi:hypothetical protein
MLCDAMHARTKPITPKKQPASCHVTVSLRMSSVTLRLYTPALSSASVNTTTRSNKKDEVPEATERDSTRVDEVLSRFGVAREQSRPTTQLDVAQPSARRASGDNTYRVLARHREMLTDPVSRPASAGQPLTRAASTVKSTRVGATRIGVRPSPMTRLPLC